MKKRFLCLVAVLAILLSLAIPGKAISVCSESVHPILSINGKTASCQIAVITGSKSAKIEITMKLYQGSTKIATWTASGTGSLSMKKTKKVTAGKTYKLTVDVTIDGKKLPTASDTASS